MCWKGEKNLFLSRQPLVVCGILRRTELEYYSSYRPNAEDPIKNGRSVLEIPYRSKISLGGLGQVHQLVKQSFQLNKVFYFSRYKTEK